MNMSEFGLKLVRRVTKPLLYQLSYVGASGARITSIAVADKRD